MILLRRLQQGERATHRNKAAAASSSCQDILVSTDASLVIDELKTKVFSHDFGQLDADGDTIVDGVYTNLLKVFAWFPNARIYFSIAKFLVRDLFFFLLSAHSFQ